MVRLSRSRWASLGEASLFAASIAVAALWSFPKAADAYGAAGIVLVCVLVALAVGGYCLRFRIENAWSDQCLELLRERLPDSSAIAILNTAELVAQLEERAAAGEGVNEEGLAESRPDMVLLASRRADTLSLYRADAGLTPIAYFPDARQVGDDADPGFLHGRRFTGAELLTQQSTSTGRLVLTALRPRSPIAPRDAS
jgi:hypothetical protein